MVNAVCRAITFINYNMPIRGKKDKWDGFDKYYTTGFFDCMYTKRVACRYDEEQLKELWDYGMECATRGEGKYAHQNIFCFSMESWNDIYDEEFWAADKDENTLLTFVTFVQARDYFTEASGIRKQCRRFNEAAQGQLHGRGRVYTYATVDKNDFVICIKCGDYKDAVNAIMKLHEAGCSVIYSYSVFGIAEKQQEMLTEEDYERLNRQRIDSISLKGVTNSVRPSRETFYSLNSKYFSFCTRLVGELYKGVQETEEADYKIYDILGDNDFRLIARTVPLGNLIRQFGTGGLLNYYGDAAQFTFFSTHLILNTRDPEKESQIPPFDDGAVATENDRIRAQYRTDRCTTLKKEMDFVIHMLKERRTAGQHIEKLTAAGHGVYQLLQSLTALEAAPTKKYDFLSMYYPLETLVHILREACDRENGAEELAENEYLYEFVHKISMTLHGTLRTDIQFFQVRDFNAIVHYAPAKLRAYYTLQVFMLSAHIKEISLETKKHSYIFCPGMFKDIAVKQLSCSPADTERLMLITVPERYLYFPKNLTIILAHEVGHLAGEKIRQRKKRHGVFLKCSYRIWCLQAAAFAYSQISKKADFDYEEEEYKSILKYSEEDLLSKLCEINEQAEEKEKDPAHMYYSELSIRRLQDVYGTVGEEYGHALWTKYGGRLQEVFQRRLKNEDGEYGDSYDSLTRNARSNLFFCESLVDGLDRLFELYRGAVLPDLLRILHYLLSEAVSDVFAVMALGLGPCEYLNSIAAEIKTDKMEEQFGRSIHKVRIAFVVYVMEQLQKEYGGREPLGRLLESWRGIYEPPFMQELKKDTEAFSLLLEAFDYECSIKDKANAINDYEDSLNRRKKAVGERKYDFLNDKAVYEEMCDYLKSCGEEYIRQLMENPKYERTRQIVAASFRRCAGDTPIGLMEETEIFLESFEKEWIKEYF